MHKAQSTVSEVRDITDPCYITQLLLTPLTTYFDSLGQISVVFDFRGALGWRLLSGS